MKKILALLTSLVLISALVSSLSADPVSSDIAAEVGRVHLQAQKESRAYSTTQAAVTGREHSVLEVRELRADGTTLAYILDLSPEGCIVISPDTDICPVIAYSFEGRFSTVDTPSNVFLHLVKWDMENRLEALPMTSESLKEENNALWENYLSQEETSIQQSSTFSVCGPHLNTTWSQHNPYSNVDDPEYDYNMYCPKDPANGYRSITGCGTTALAQIINYHQYPSSVSFDQSDSYTSTRSYSKFSQPYTLTVNIDGDYDAGYDFPSFAELNQMLSDIKYYQGDLHYFDQGEWVYPVDEEGNIHADEIKQDIPALCFACGIAVQMEYSPAGSTASTPYSPGGTMDYSPLKDKFGYDSAIVADEIWFGFYSTLEQNMKDGQPAMLSITGAQGGHLLVADGFNDADGKYHLNLGWGAANPAQVWYSLPTEMPQGYDVVNLGILDIVPGVTDTAQQVVDLYQGWTLISTRLNPTDPSPSSVFNGINDCTAVWAYYANPGGWKRYIPGGSANDLDIIEPGRGYWVNMTAGDTLTITGQEITNTDVELFPGWNLVGYNSSTSQSPANALFGIDYTSIWAYVGGVWLRHIKVADFLDTLTQLNQGVGYWIFMGNGDTWIVP